MNKYVGVKHGRHHMVIGQWCKTLTNTRGTTDNDSGPQGTLVKYMWCK